MTSEFTSTDPAEILSTAPHRPSREQTMKTVQDKWPGHITFASDRASFSGCRVISFRASGWDGLEGADDTIFEAQVGAFLEARENEYNALPDDVKEHCDLTVRVGSPHELMNLYFSTRANLLVLNMTVTDESITCLVTTQLDAEDLEEMQEVSKRVNLEMREWRQARAAAKAQEADQVREERRLAEVGRNAEEYNLAGRLEKAKAEISELRAKLEDLNAVNSK